MFYFYNFFFPLFNKLQVYYFFFFLLITEILRVFFSQRIKTIKLAENMTDTIETDENNVKLSSERVINNEIDSDFWLWIISLES